MPKRDKGGIAFVPFSFPFVLWDNFKAIWRKPMEKDTMGVGLKEGSWWNGKLWFAYGTSITSEMMGNYVPYLKEFSGLKCVNRGFPGGGIGNFGEQSRGEVKKLIFEDDGKDKADLITLEVGANDAGENVPLGTIYDADENTLCGCLNLCIRHLQKVSKAQIVIIASPVPRADPADYKSYYETAFLFEKIAFINRVWFIKGNSTLGFGRVEDDLGLYLKDDSILGLKYDIHQTKVAGYNLAQSIWAELKHIPLFYVKLPNR